MRLRTTLFGLLVVVGLVLSGVVYASFALHKADITAQEQRAVATTSQTVANDLDTRLVEKTRTVELWAAHRSVSEHGSGEQAAALATFVDRTDFQGATIVNDEGTIVAADISNADRERERELIGHSLAERKYVRVALNGSTHVSDPFQAESGNYIVTISAPIQDDSGTIVGTLNGAFHLSEPRFFHDAAALAGGKQSLTIRANSGENASMLYSEPVPDGPAFTATAIVDETGWVVTVSESESVIADRLWEATLTQAGAVGLTLLAFGIVGVWVSRTTLRQIDDLIDELHALESGDYETRRDFGPIDEWGQIATQFNDLSATLRRRESQLRVLNRVLRHNLRNDMTVVLTYADGVLTDESVPAHVRDHVEQIRHTASSLIDTSEHARAVYDELLNRGERERTPTRLDQVIDDVVIDLVGEFPEATFETAVEADAWVLDTDTVPIVVGELCRNALRHNDRPPAERTVRITAESDGETTRVVVEDNGQGLPDLERDLLAGDRQETPIEHGSGLGVWLVNWLVQRLGGTVSVDTDDGTRVEVTFPAPQSVPESASDSAPD